MTPSVNSYVDFVARWVSSRELAAAVGFLFLTVSAEPLVPANLDQT